MTTYSSKPVDVAMPASTVFDRISNLGSFQERIEQLPEDVKAKIGSVTFTEDTIVINAAPMGDMTLRVTERIPAKRLALTAENAPVPIILSVNLNEKDTDNTEVVTSIDVDMPA
ncbi:MAG: hypothetical protein K2L31_04425, partial [Muribaculum sp.]|nr:hypothetical protein [Muribaculum sp.]